MIVSSFKSRYTPSFNIFAGDPPSITYELLYFFDNKELVATTVYGWSWAPPKMVHLVATQVSCAIFMLPYPLFA